LDYLLDVLISTGFAYLYYTSLYVMCVRARARNTVFYTCSRFSSESFYCSLLACLTWVHIPL